MWLRLHLRTRIFTILMVFVLVILSGGASMIWYTYQMETLFTQLVATDVTTMQEVAGLESDLANQKGFVSYYFIDRDARWLDVLDTYRESFRTRLADVKERVSTKEDKAIVDDIEAKYGEYIHIKDRVIALYKEGNAEFGAELHQKARMQFFDLLELGQQLTLLHKQRIQTIQEESGIRAQRLRFGAVTTMFVAVCLGCLLAVVLMGQVLGPIRRLTRETDRSGECERSENEVTALGRQVRGIIKDMEKFALVGKLAAGVAHSIRNPLTSVKMRLFSMERSLELDAVQKEDFDVISEEIRHIDTIVGNFLEFSRPPKLKMQPVVPSDSVDNALQLLRHRLESFNVTVEVQRAQILPDISGDPEQLKELIVNLLVNACEAMPHGGLITIHEHLRTDASGKRFAVIEIKDNGPGIPASIQENVLQPFFSTKEEGTGLGLPIAARIAHEHGGELNLRSREGAGTTFIIMLPLPFKQEDNEHHSSGR